MTNFTNDLTSDQVAPALESLTILNLVSPATTYYLYWQNEFVDIPLNSPTQAYAARIIEINSNVDSANILVLPPANIVSVGTQILFTNLSGNDFTLQDNDLGFVTVVPHVTSSNAVTVYLSDNTDAAGEWVPTLHIGGGIGVTGITTTSANTNVTLVNTGFSTSPNIEVGLANDLLRLTEFGSFGIGAAFRIDPLSPDWVLRAFQGTVNQINVINGDGVSGNPTFSLNPNLTGLTSVIIGSLNITGSTITGSPQDVILNPGAGAVSIAASGTLRLIAPDTVHFFQVTPGTMAASVSLTLPTIAPIAGDMLTCTSPGVLAWAQPNASIRASGTVTMGMTSATVVTSLPIGVRIFLTPNTPSTAQLNTLMGHLQAYAISATGFSIQTTATDATGLMVSWIAVL